MAVVKWFMPALRYKQAAAATTRVKYHKKFIPPSVKQWGNDQHVLSPFFVLKKCHVRRYFAAINENLPVFHANEHSVLA